MPREQTRYIRQTQIKFHSGLFICLKKKLFELNWVERGGEKTCSRMQSGQMALDWWGNNNQGVFANLPLPSLQSDFAACDSWCSLLEGLVCIHLWFAYLYTSAVVWGLHFTAVCVSCAALLLKCLWACDGRIGLGKIRMLRFCVLQVSQ